MAAGEIVALNAGKARADVVPGMAGLWVDGLPVLRPWNDVPQEGPFALAMNLLAPFSNRIDMQFAFGGKLHELQPTLEDGQFGPWQYRAECHYALGPTRLDVTLSIKV